MELRHLRYFLAIAEHSHFGAAAEELMVSQPTLSQQMKDLESELGIALFERVGRGVKLSQAGHLYREVARHALGVLEEGESMLHEFEQMLRGSLSIGVVQTVNAYLIPSVVAKFVREYPKVKLLIEELSAAEIEDRLGNAVLDLGISFSPSSGIDLVIEPLFEKSLFWLFTLDIGGRNAKAFRSSHLPRNPCPFCGEVTALGVSSTNHSDWLRHRCVLRSNLTPSQAC